VILGIDASNIRGGGGVTHLIEVLRTAEPSAHGFRQVIVWGGEATLSRLLDRPWLLKAHQPQLDKGLAHRSFWQRARLSGLARKSACDVLFVPGGSFVGDFRPMVTMSRNMLPVEWEELRRFGWSLMTLKLIFLRFVQSRTFRRADGLICLTIYARDTVMRMIKATRGETTIIPHGVGERFTGAPREARAIGEHSAERPFRLLYVSNIDVYKHAWHVADAVTRLRASGLPVVLDLVGPAYAPALRRLRRTLDRVDPTGAVVHYHGAVPYSELHAHYEKADLAVFASSCENMPNILLEGMASGLAVACSDRGPMPEVLGRDGVYFDPEDPADIARALRELIESPELRDRTAKASFERSRSFSWDQCAANTFDFLAATASRHVRQKGGP
jgi:glycosyltransferase involved in cell wall biosynthesis